MRLRGATRWLVVAGVGSALGCASRGGTPPSHDWLRHLSAAPRPPAGTSWVVPPAQAEALMQTGEGEVRSRERLAGGITGADRVTVYFPSADRTLELKWKAAPPGDADGWNNAPRKELAAYEVQKWFLPPESYVVPTTAARCVALEAYRELDAEAQPTLPGTRCVFGVMALWLHDVHAPDSLYDEERFYRDPAYARHLADFNLFAYLIEDRDTRKGNVLTAKDESNRRVFTVDNGISFAPRFYNFFVNQWDRIRVPALPRDSVERLRRVTRDRVRALGVVVQLAVDEQGVLRPVPPGPPIDPTRGSRFRDGVLQLGLTGAEIEHVWERLQALLEQLDEQEIPLF